MALCLWGIAESLYGLLQVLELRTSAHPLFTLTGHFENPGPYGGFVACICAVAAMYVIRHRNAVCTVREKLMMAVSLITVLCCVLVIPASLSRSAWVGLAVSMAIVLLTDGQVRGWMHRHIVMTGCLAVIVAAVGCGTFFLKKDSAMGRFHIWRIDMMAIADAPLSGHGRGFEMGAYGRAQERFFRARLDDGTVTDAVVRVAGCPEYPFNEYLGLGMARGVPAMLLAVAITLAIAVNLWRKDSPMAAGFTTLAVFACASYPMTQWQFWVLLCAFVSGCGARSQARNRLSRVADIMVPAAALSLTAVLGITAMRQVADDEASGFRAIYDEGYSLHCSGLWEESNEMLKQGAEMSSDSMFHVIMGKNHEAMGDYAAAESEYLKARYMVPCRIYPLVRLMRLQVRTGRDADALQTARTIASLPVNERMVTMVKLRDESLKTLDSLKTVLHDE